MKVLKTLMWTVAGVTALGVMGCDVFMGGRAREEPVIVEQRPVVVEQRPVYVEQRPVIVERAPPPLIEVQVR